MKLFPQSKMVIDKASVWFILSVFILLSFVAAEENDCIYYFYGEGCEECKIVDDHLTKLEEKYPALQLERYEVYFHKDNSRLLKRYFVSYIGYVRNIVFKGS